MLVWVRKGRKCLYSAHVEAEFDAGDVMVLAEGSKWDVINDIAPHGIYEAMVLQFGSEAIRAFSEHYQSYFSVKRLQHWAKLRMDAQLEQSVRRAADGLAEAVISPRMKLHRMLEVMLLLAERGCLIPPEKELNWPDKVRRLVSHQPAAPWSLEQVAQSFYMSESSLRRRLAEHGTTVGEVVRDMRLEVALLLLQTTQLPVNEVSLRCGYDSHSRFTAAFRKRYGFPPSFFRSKA